jgi:peptide/nickel transport system permease protein
MPVSSLIRARCRNTVLLAATAMFIVWIIAVPLGIATASKGGWLDRICSLGSSFLLSVPELVIILALLAIAVRTGYMPAGGMTSDFTHGSNAWSLTKDVALHMIVPALALALVGLPIVLQHTRTAVKETMDAPFIKAARGHGIGSSRLLIRHVLPAAANPLISLFGLSIAGLVGTSLLAEVVTGWPGLGPLFVESIFARDFYVVIAIVMLASSFLVIGNLLGDLLLCAADPRIRAE